MHISPTAGSFHSNYFSMMFVYHMSTKALNSCNGAEGDLVWTLGCEK